jgi:hypothetical protein
MERYTAMYPRGQSGLRDDQVMAYVNDLHATGAAIGSMTTRRAQITRWHDPTRECNVCVTFASSISEPEPALRHRTTDAQRRARLDELVEVRHQLDKELALLHQELGMDAEPATDDQHETSLCRKSPMRGTTTNASVVRLSTSRTVVHQCHRRAGQHTTTTDAPTRVRMLTSTPTLTLRHCSIGCHRTLPLWPCYCTAARRQRPPRNDECANN